MTHRMSIPMARSLRLDADHAVESHPPTLDHQAEGRAGDPDAIPATVRSEGVLPREPAAECGGPLPPHHGCGGSEVNGACIGDAGLRPPPGLRCKPATRTSDARGDSLGTPVLRMGAGGRHSRPGGKSPSVVPWRAPVTRVG